MRGLTKWLLLAAALFALFVWLRTRRTRVTVSGRGVEITTGRLFQRRRERVLYSELGEIALLTDWAGAEAAVLELSREGRSPVMIPAYVFRGTPLIEHLAALPGFDRKALLEGLQSRGRKRIVCWRG
jgi:hypothetical protein